MKIYEYNVCFFYLDVVGQAIDIGEKLTLQCSGGKEKKKIEFTLRDIK